MVLVDYSSDSDSEPLSQVRSTSAAAKRKRSDEQVSQLPSLPAEFHDLYATAVRSGVRDDPSLHEGRARAVPHVEGNWPSHVYIDWRPTAAETNVLGAVIRKIQPAVSATAGISAIHSSLKTSLGTDAPLHISLSRTLSLATEQRHLFLNDIESRLRQEKVTRFEAHPTLLDWVPNHEGNRWFLILRLDRDSSELLRTLLHVCNCAAGSFGQQKLYEDGFRTAKKNRLETGSSDNPKSPADARAESPFHVSIAWTLQEPDKTVLANTTSVRDCDLASIAVPVDCVKIKVGNRVHSLSLLGGQEAHTK